MCGIKKTEPLVSVIINCYNSDKFLKEAIESVFAQTYENWEIIFWDNQSEDKSAAIAQSYGKKVKYFLAPTNTPLGEARNLAIQKATGEYIAFIDCDDIWFPEKLERQVKQLEANPDFVLSYCGVEEINSKGKHFRYYVPQGKSGYIINELLLDFNIHIIASMIRKSMLDESGLNFDKEMTASEEYCLFMQLASLHSIGVINEALAKYRVLEDSLTLKKQDQLGFERRYTLSKVEGLLDEKMEHLRSSLKAARARSYYYDAKYYMNTRQRTKARSSMLKTGMVQWQYMILLVLTFLPFKFWHKIQVFKYNRS